LTSSSWFYLRERNSRKAAEAARANETRLLRQSKARESISQAAILLADGKIEEADALLVKTPLTSIEPSLEATKLFRALGDWNGIRQRWKQSADCYTLLLQAKPLDPVPVPPNFLTILDAIAPTLVEAGNVSTYRNFCDEVITRYGTNTDPINAADLLKACLLLPADAALSERLRPAADVVAASLAEDDQSRGVDAYQSAFMALSLSMMEYRRGNFSKATEWTQRCLAFPDKNESRSAAAHAIFAMAAQRLGQRTLALSELMQARAFFAGPFAQEVQYPRGDRQGFWFDWTIARILLREASGQVESASGSAH
jgi:hypothetical protein